MHILVLLSLLLALAVTAVSASPTPNGTRPNSPKLIEHKIGSRAASNPNGPLPNGFKLIDKIHPRAPVPIPSILNLNPDLLLHKRDDTKVYTFGALKASKTPSNPKLEAPFNETAGSTWCNEIADVGTEKDPHNQILNVTINSHVDWPGPENRPPEYVCFFYTSRGKCDPHDGHAEYIESVPGPKGSANETEFDSRQWRYISWACQWHPLNKKSTNGGTGWP